MWRKRVKVRFEENDKEIVWNIIYKAKKMAQSVNSIVANSSLSCDKSVIEIDALTGVVAEELCVQAINVFNNNLVAQYIPYTN